MIWRKARRPLGVEIMACGQRATDRQQTGGHRPVLLRGMHTNRTIPAVFIRSINDSLNLLMALAYRLKRGEKGIQRLRSRARQEVTYTSRHKPREIDQARVGQ